MTSRILRSIVLVSALATSACGGGESNLSAARDLVGTWKTTVPVTVFLEVPDWCLSGPSRVSQDWTVTWVITPGVDENHVAVQMSFATANTQVLAGCPDTGVIPEVSPMFLTGTISAATLKLKNGADDAGTFTFTTHNLQGDLDYTWCAAFCQREYTQNRELILTR